VSEERLRTTVDVAPAAQQGKSLIVFMRPWLPGWRATLNGRPLSILRADSIMPAVEIDSHEHGHLVLEYRPASLLIGGRLPGGPLSQRPPNVPLPIRVLLPFAFYFAYPFTVVARSYVILGPLLIAVAAIYDRRSERFWLFIAILLAMANVSIHGTGIASALALLFVIDEWRARRNGRPAVPLPRLFLGAALFVIDVAFIALVIFPPADISGRFDIG